MTARADILAAIPATASDPASIAAAAWRLLDAVPGLRPDRVGPDLIETFRTRVTQPAIGATTEIVPNLAALPDAVLRYRQAHRLDRAVAVQPHPRLRALDWHGVTVTEAIRIDEQTAVQLADYGIAETASVVFHSGPNAPTLFAFMPEHHIVALEASRILPWLEDYAAALAQGPHPRNVNLVTGASGTTDIEGALVRGAHGPASLHIVIVDDRNP